jgi:predicted hotdog family 3-hydroxylacyl-ACP dehydratase
MNDLNHLDVESLIPHRSPMRLLDQVLAVDDAAGRLTAAARVSPLWPLFDQGQAPSVLGLELIAQAVACRSGLDRADGPGTPSFGYLAGIKSAEFHTDRFDDESALEITVVREYGQGELGVYTGTVSVDGRVLVEAVVQVMSPSPESEAELMSALI